MPSGELGVILEEVLADRYTAETKVIRFVAKLDPRWDLSKAVDKGALDDEGNTYLLYGVSLYNEGKLQSARRQFQKALAFENSEKYAEQWIKVVNRDLE